ncbi:unnamed protein product [Phytomonas sp. EM1]|nr:unnamed protein product [Phytomonas sp. EM1]|eukprot:CCW60438.1 unnamed protein product [Phytomonas sp. isolate EM1]
MNTEPPSMRPPKNQTACGVPLEVPFYSSPRDEKLKDEPRSIAGAYVMTKASVEDGQSVLKQLLDRRANLPVPSWASKAKAWRPSNNGNITASGGYPLEGGGGSTGVRLSPDLYGRRDDVCEYVPLLHRSEFPSSAGDRQQRGTTQADLDGFQRSPSNEIGTQTEDLVEPTEDSELIPNLSQTTHSSTIGNDVGEESGDRKKGGQLTTRVCGTSRHIISDPVDWLSQAADCPLMDPELFSSHPTPLTALKLHSPTLWDDSRNNLMSSEVHQDADDDKNPNNAILTNAEVVERVNAPLKSNRAIQKDVQDALGDHMLRPEEGGPVEESKKGTSKDSATGLSDPSVRLPHARKDDKESFVFNVFTRRVVKQTSPSVHALSLIGIAVDDATQEFVVKDAAALQEVARAIRQKRLSWPSAWSRGGLYARLKYLLLDEHIEDPAGKVEELLRAQYQRRRGLSHTGVVVAPPSVENATGELIEPPRASLPAAEVPQKGDERLFTMEDLSVEQQAVVRFVLQGYHTYIGGGAGTGKSALLHVLKHRLRREGLRVAVTATTGVASSHIGGSTLHHCFGINLHGDFTRRAELAAYDAIIIDEVSMLPRELFEALEYQLRRANGVNLPFGGVQMILCGDFMQLGAIAAEPILHSPVFRSNFAMLKLMQVIRQSENPIFALQLQALRRGRVPAGLEKTIQFISTKQSREESDQIEQLRKRQRAQLHAIVASLPTSQPPGILPQSSVTVNGDAIPPLDEVENENSPTQATPSIHLDNLGDLAPTLNRENSPGSLSPTHYVEGAVNLFPTNQQVQETNLRELAKLPGEVVVYHAQLLPPALSDTWSPTYLLHVKGQAKLHVKKIAREIELYLSMFFEKVKDWDWWWTRMLGQQNIVLYHLFSDALALRVRIPHGFDGAAGLLTHMAGLADYLSSLSVEELGVRVREIIPSAEGLHTEEDEYILEQYAARSPMNAPLPLKVGARVMLRANLAPGLVNGSLGTVVGFRELHPDQLPAHLTANPQREEVVRGYVDFLRYEHGFAVPLLPEVDFGDGRVEVIFPASHLVGGLSNTHHYSLSIVALPLTLAYAFTVHKVQGLTLVGRVHLELSRMWPCEHLLYVAMSRVRNPDQLSISNFEEHLVCAGAACLVFDDSLPSVEQVKVLPHFIQATWFRAPTQRKKALRKKELEQLKQRRRQKAKERLCEDAKRIISELSSATEA